MEGNYRGKEMESIEGNKWKLKRERDGKYRGKWMEIIEGNGWKL